jgi:formamidopyrimidine-DNA glycosylase
MPELPEVETVRRGLEPLLVGKTICGIQIKQPAILLPEPEAFATILPGLQIMALKRQGKYLIFELSDDWRLVIHLRMTGKLLWTPQGQSPVPIHTHVIIDFPIGQQLRFHDVRRFGRWWLVPANHLQQISGLAKLGPEPIQADFSGLMLAKQLKKKTKTKIKSALLDQTIVAGLGNIYVDETLFTARIHPQRTVDSLTIKDINKLAEAAQQVLELAIERRGTSFRDYLDGLAQPGENQNYLQVFHRAGEPCPHCGNLIQREKIAGRSSFYCPICQELARSLDK